MRTTVRLDDDLLKRAKIKAAAEGRTLTDLIEEGLRVLLAGKPAPAEGAEPSHASARRREVCCPAST